MREKVVFSSGVTGMAMDLGENTVDVVLFGEDRSVFEGMEVRRTKQFVDVPVGKALLGRVVNALGNPIDGIGLIRSTERGIFDLKTPQIIERQSVHEARG